MKFVENDIIVKEYRDAFLKYASQRIIDMDDHLKQKFNFQIHRLENIVPAWGGVVPANRQSQFFIVLVKEGTGEKTIGHLRFPIQKNTLMVIPQKVAHSSKYSSLKASGYMLSFDIGFFFRHFFPKDLIANKRIFKKSLKPFIILTNDQAEYLSRIFEDLLREYNEQLLNKDEMIAIKVLELLVQCDRYFINAEPRPFVDSHSQMIESFHELVKANFVKERTVQFYANALHIHPNYLNFLTKKYTGMTPKQIIADHIFLEAKNLLVSTSLAVKEISYELGFTSPDRFSSFFSKLSNMPPSKYRQEILS
jgi:AraC family transcriptional activator of pobA